MFKLLSDQELCNTDFPDKRLEKRYGYLKKSLEEGQSCVLNQVTNNRAERKGGYDFFQNARLTENLLKEQMYLTLEERRSAIEGEHLIVPQDTTEYNFASNIDRIRDKSGLGSLTNKSGLGYIAHVSLALRADDMSVIGLSDLQLWHREADRARANTRKQRIFEEKESYKWHVGLFNSHQRLQSAKTITYIQDRDGDIYESIVKVIQLPGAELLVRSCRDRKIELPDGSKCMLYGHLLNQEVAFSYELKVRGDKRKGRKSRMAKMDVRTSQVKLVCPENVRGQNPLYVEVDVVWVKENPASIPPGESAIDWKLITTHKVVEDNKLVMQLIKWYGNRWIIEEFFFARNQEPTTWKMLYWKRGMACAN
jgi:hypothetical protein